MRREMFNRLCLTLLVFTLVGSFGGYSFYSKTANESQENVNFWNDRMSWHDENCGEYRDKTKPLDNKCYVKSRQEFRSLFDEAVTERDQAKNYAEDLKLAAWLSPLAFAILWIAISFVVWGNIRFSIKNR